MLIIIISVICFLFGVWYEKRFFTNSKTAPSRKKIFYTDGWANYLISILAVIIGAGITIAADNYMTYSKDRRYVINSLEQLTNIGDNYLVRAVSARLSYLKKDYSTDQYAIASFVPIDMYENFVNGDKAVSYMQEQSYYSISAHISFTKAQENKIENGFYNENKIYTTRISIRDVEFYKALILMRAEEMRMTNKLTDDDLSSINSATAPSGCTLTSLSDVVKKYNLGLTTYTNADESDSESDTEESEQNQTGTSEDM